MGVRNLLSGSWVPAILVLALVSSVAFSQTATEAEPGLSLHDFTTGAPSGVDPANNPIGFVTWQDGSSDLTLTVQDVEPDDAHPLPGQSEAISVLEIQHGISSWGGFTHAFHDTALTRWEPRDLSGYVGIRFWFRGDGAGDTVQFDLFDNRNASLPGDSAERYAVRFTDDTPAWRHVHVPFTDLVRRTDFQPGGAPDDGLTLRETWGWALGFAPGSGVSYVYGVEAYGDAGVETVEGATVSFGSVLYRVEEGDTLQVDIVLSEPLDEAVSVRVFVEGDGATAMRDVVTRSELAVFPPGVQRVTVPVHTIDDRKAEGDERATVSLGQARGAQLGFQRLAIILIEDDDAPIDGQWADFELGVEPFVELPSGVGVEERVDTHPKARPEQDRFERMLYVPGGSLATTLQASFPERRDWRDRHGLTFWFEGRGDGQPVTLTLLDAAEEPSAWVPTFADEFNASAGTPVDPAVWTHERGDGTDNGIPGWGNNELQTYTDHPDNVSHDGLGHLVVQAREAGADAPVCYHGAPCGYTSARIITKDKVEVRYGRVEARMRLPSGQGLWPAFWMLGANLDEVSWPASGEIDIVENVGFEPSTVHGTIHGPGYSGGNGIGRPYRLPANARFADAFHTFAIEWEPGRLQWFVDDVPYSTLTPDDLPRDAAWVFDAPFFMILNLAVGGNWPGAPDETTVFPQALVVDYIRVFERADTAERFEATFVDDEPGWRRVYVPFTDFRRAVEQPADAPDDGLSLHDVMGVSLTFESGGELRLDDLRVE